MLSQAFKLTQYLVLAYFLISVVYTTHFLLSGWSSFWVSVHHESSYKIVSCSVSHLHVVIGAAFEDVGCAILVLVFVETFLAKGARAFAFRGVLEIPDNASENPDARVKRTGTHLHLTRAMLFLYCSITCAFIGSPSG